MLGVSQEALGKIKTFVLLVTGGIGRNICATAVVRNLKKAHPDKNIIVVCGVADIFLKNPNVYKVYNLNQPFYLFEDYFLNGSSMVINVEPYQHPEYLAKRMHFTKAWCELIGIPCEDIHPEIFFTDMEKSLALDYTKGFSKPLVLCQFEGGKVPNDKTNKERLVAKSAMYRRSIPEKVQQEITDGLIERNFIPAVVAHENQFIPLKAEKIFFSARAITALLPHIQNVICIDSFLLHGTAVFKKEAIVCWAGTSPEVLGYSFHKNLRRAVCPTPECHRPNSYLFDLEPNGFQWECPYNDKCTGYESSEILKAFDEKTESKKGVEIGTEERIEIGLNGNSEVRVHSK